MTAVWPVLLGIGFSSARAEARRIHRLHGAEIDALATVVGGRAEPGMFRWRVVGTGLEVVFTGDGEGSPVTLIRRGGEPELALAGWRTAEEVLAVLVSGAAPRPSND